MTFTELSEFIDQRMRMSHVYQPVMIKTLLRAGGTASEREIARRLLFEDESQLEYYEQVTRNMVGRVLRRHSVVTRDRSTKTYELVGFSELAPSEVRELIEKCETKLAAFLEKRKSDPWGHRRRSAGYVSGTLRYEVYKSAGFHCELCGVPADERALEVDHILPRNHGGTDDISNLQALCYSCNSMKRDRDNTDFRVIRESYEERYVACAFCTLPTDRIEVENELAVLIADGYPVTPGHRLIIPKRHVASYFDLHRPELNACRALLSNAKEAVLEAFPEVEGFNIGVNEGEVAGRTIHHCHIHLIPRRSGDVANPVGGVRNVIPGKADYTR